MDVRWGNDNNIIVQRPFSLSLKDKEELDESAVSGFTRFLENYIQTRVEYAKALRKCIVWRKVLSSECSISWALWISFSDMSEKQLNGGKIGNGIWDMADILLYYFIYYFRF